MTPGRSLKLGGVAFSTSQLRELGMPVFILLVLAMMLLPLPPLVLDLLFTFNIAISLLVLMVSIYTKRPLDFAVFPSVILVTTLLRLSLNVASTRVVLMHGHSGPDAAGKVIEAFGQFLVGGNFAVGVVVFLVLVIINFVVITKGAGRIAEVSARFTLDAMPGKQMAIDADLNAGLVDEATARKRRAEVSQEADFYGAMDGASKFVRGDAIAGILILFVNIVGGLLIGVAQHDLSFAEAGRAYVLLSIGDGLVAQVPALLVSIAAGLIVSRVGEGEDIGTEVGKQLLGTPQAVALSAGIIGMLGLVPGMPNVAFITLSAGMAALSWYLAKMRQQAAARAAAPAAPAAPAESQEASWDDVTQVDTVGLEVGYRLIPLVDKTGDGDLLKRIKALRKKFAQDVGFLPAAVHIRDNLELKPGGYRITLKGVSIGETEVQTGGFLAINPGRVTREVPGTPTRDPAFGLPAMWIEAGTREAAQAAGYTVVDIGTVIATHLSHLLHNHAADLLGRAELQALCDHFSRGTPKLLEDLVPKLLPMAVLQRVLQSLLDEGVHIRDFGTIVETLSEHAVHTQDPVELVGAVRVALGRAITQSIFGASGDVEVLALDPELERILQNISTKTGEIGAIEPGLAERLLREAGGAVEKMDGVGKPAALLVPDRLRLALARLFRRSVPRLKVLAHSEIPESRLIRVAMTLGGR
ncbi:Flagellar biosynthesis protein FlhA [Pigmentiphaga humi]|uniref:Flagellar biosynthesis protein FlhA n=1 Tax=Pigmentiphaga humi TaxID=2478468 RepID=A0A3P4B1H7_9BURK|nr:flagellar biosynthesis protein FlhA [Pigmentiphaga humi]VCU69912.1 Flagellar biosynthesis protein FlhA [Pigmentiphaga humi]